MHTVVCLCVLFCSGRKFGISQHRLVSAVETSAVFFKTMITSCTTSCFPSPTPNFICVCACAHRWLACTSVLPRCIKRNAPCVAFSSLYRASPLSHVIMENPTTSHTSDKTQSPAWVVCRLRNSAEIYAHVSQPASTVSQSHSLSIKPAGLFSLDNVTSSA